IRVVLHRPHQPLLRAELQDLLRRQINIVIVEIELQQAVAFARAAIRAACVPARRAPDRQEDAMIVTDGAGAVDLLPRKLLAVLQPALQQSAENLAPVDLAILLQILSACSPGSIFAGLPKVRATMSGWAFSCQGEDHDEGDK